MLTDKKLERIEKILGKETVEEMKIRVFDELKNSIMYACEAVKQAEDELEANPKYQEIKESMKALREGLTEVKKRQNAIVQYSLHLLEEKGNV